MQSRKEAILSIYRGEKAEFIPRGDRGIFNAVFPGERYFPSPFEPYGTGPDAWGGLWTNQGPDPGLDGNTVAADFRLFNEVEDWKEHVKFPDLSRIPVAPILHGMSAHVNREDTVLSCLMLSGQFERLNQMVGMENALCAFYECPDELHEFFDAMCEYKLNCIQLAYDAIHPEIIHMHDDWGTGSNMFFSPDLWREFIKPNELRYSKKIHELGMLYEHHSCGYIQQIIPDLVEIGVDCLNPLNSCNDVEKIKRECGGRITLKGGVNNQFIESGHATEEEIRAEARRVMDAYGAGGRYLPDYVATNGSVRDIFFDEVERYGQNFYR